MHPLQQPLKDLIRPMTTADVEAVLEIEKLSFPSAWSRDSYLRDLANPKCVYFVTERAGRVVAYAGIWVVEDEAHITTLAVHPTCRRQGLACKLIETVIHAAAARGAEIMTLEVRLQNSAALKLYQSFGFLPVGKIKHYYLDTGEDALVMRLNPLRLPSKT